MSIAKEDKIIHPFQQGLNAFGLKDGNDRIRHTPEDTWAACTPETANMVDPDITIF
jgi:hypothetical protein